MNIKTETIKKRRSVRTFEKREIEKKEQNIIIDYLSVVKHSIGPFGTQVNVDYIPVIKNKTDKGIKLGTYGFIKHPQGYLVGRVENKTSKLIEFGYVFEKLVLYLTQIGLGTCWLGGSFTRHSFEKEVDLKDGEIIPCITPVGYTLEKQRILERAMRTAVKADRKKSWSELFFKGDFATPLAQEEAQQWEVPIEMVRLGPSASNKQPWRIVVSEDREIIHLYIEETPNYGGNKLGFHMQMIDIGIAMCHFELACQELDINGTWQELDPKLNVPNEHTKYVISWRKQ